MRTSPLVVMSAAAATVMGVPALAGPVSPQSAAAVAGGTALSRAHPVLRFAGRMHNPVPVPMASDPDPTVCAVNCEQWWVRVATTRQFLVSIHNATNSVDDGFDLYVYDARGTRIAAADNVGSNGQAVAVRPSRPGRFTIAVAMTYAYDTDAAYLGEVRLMSGPSWSTPHCRTRRPCPVLPALRVQAAADVHVDGIPPVASTPLGFPIPVDASTGNSCYADETASTKARRCLRFTSEVDDVGAGVLDLRIPWVTAGSGAPRSGFVPGQCSARQVITMSDGTQRTRAAGSCEYHVTHGHFHYRDVVAFGLHRVRADGTTGALVARSLKESFCLADDGYFGFGRRAPNGPRNYPGQPGCNLPSTAEASAGNAWISMGISPGWGDIYSWDTPDQFIDITSVPPGVYDIVSTANPTGELLLSGRARPCATTRIRLTADAVTTLARGIRCRAG